jgi:hypothetical protein
MVEATNISKEPGDRGELLIARDCFQPGAMPASPTDMLKGYLLANMSEHIGPIERSGAGMVFDQKRKKTVLFCRGTR